MGIMGWGVLDIGLPPAGDVAGRGGGPYGLRSTGFRAHEVLIADGDRLATESDMEIVLAGITALRPDPMSQPNGRALLAELRGGTVQARRRRPARPLRADAHARLRHQGQLLVEERLPRAGTAVGAAGQWRHPLHGAAVRGRGGGARGWRGALWRTPGIVARATDPTSLSARVGLYALAEGRIVSVGYGSRMVFLDFGLQFADPIFTCHGATIARSAPSRSRNRSRFLVGRGWVGRAGAIEESGGPAIRLTDPLALEILDRAE